MSPARDLPRPLLLGGLLGSALAAVGGLGAGALPRPGPGSWLGLSLAGSPAGRAAGLALVVAGVVLLAGAWWRARLVLDDVAPRALVRATALWSVPLLLGPPLFSRDVYAYGAQALIAARGFDPYVLGPIEGGGAFSAHVDVVWRGAPAPYGPAFLGPGALLVRLTGADVVGTVLALRLLVLLGMAALAWGLLRVARAGGAPPARALWLGLANPLLLLHGVSGAHNDALMAGLVVAGVAVGLVPTTRRLVAAGAVVAVAGLVKAPGLAALPVLVLAVPGLRARARAAVLVGGGAVAAAVSTALASGLGWGWLGTLDTGRTLLSLFSPVTGLATLAGRGAELVGLTGSTDAVRAPVLDTAALVAVGAAAALLLLTPRLGPVRALGLALLAVVALSPTVLPWYLLWGVLPLAAVAGRRLALGLGAACLVLCLATWPDGRSVVRPPLYGVPLVAAAAAGLVAARSAGERAPATN
ncbi:MAG TPA: polyprenol phosphomannose-dependent alpha 1,6 mannosyltransferase MptB [Mycobacteriales bacterium]|nr:polyprenol phosphomannose-dependent alpha 1,6 mannosyltransferase MptB [Mycobacteriales bacterium]